MMLAMGLPMAVASSHSAYYSVFQMMKYVLAQFMGVSYEQQNDTTKGKDSHESLLKIFLNLLKTKVGKPNIIIGILSIYQSIKKMRSRCDYNTDKYTNEQLLTNVAKAKEFNSKMSNIFNFAI
ncbi:MAG: hypothetical protein IKP73_16625 [Bacteroidales bacterium]|nr:hypothetical protein [Bacteroidales bacterium]